MKERALILAAIGALLVLCLVWFLSAYERVTRTEYLPASAEARLNRFLAAQRLLGRFEIEVRRVDGLEGDHPLPPGAALLVPERRGAMSERALARIESFVESGGHLIVEAEAPKRPDPLLERFGIQRIEAEGAGPDLGQFDFDYDFHDDDESDDYDEDDEGDQGAGGDTEIDAEAGPMLHRPPAGRNTQHTGAALGEPELALRIAGRLRLHTDTALVWEFGDPLGNRGLQRTQGSGRITALIRMSAFENARIGDLDHAEFLYRLLRQEGLPPVVIFVDRWRGGLADWLLDSAWRVLIALGVLILALLWAAAPRFGPVAPDPAPVRRRLLDHLTASGRLLWSRNERRFLAGAARQAALQRVRTEYPHTAALPPESLAGFLMRRFGFDTTQTQLLLGTTTPSQPLAFIALVRVCRRVHAVLSAPHKQPHSDPLYEP